MNKKIGLYFSLAIIIAFIAFIVYDSATGNGEARDQKIITTPEVPSEPAWSIEVVKDVPYGKLMAVTCTSRGVVVAGDSFVTLYNNNLEPVWDINPGKGVMAIASSGDTIYAATTETILLLDFEGRQVDEWGPYDENSIITSVSAGNSNVAFADAGGKIVFVLDKSGALVSIVGQPGNHFIIPSPYFDLSITGDLLVTANPGKRNIEYRKINGDILKIFGEAGTAPEYFCGCCNPSHFAIMENGNIVTAEKGINRIKIINPEGELVELVAQPGHFMASIPVDLAAGDDNTIYAANPADSKLYLFKRKR